MAESCQTSAHTGRKIVLSPDYAHVADVPYPSLSPKGRGRPVAPVLLPLPLGEGGGEGPRPSLKYVANQVLLTSSRHPQNAGNYQTYSKHPAQALRPMRGVRLMGASPVPTAPQTPRPRPCRRLCTWSRRLFLPHGACLRSGRGRSGAGRSRRRGGPGRWRRR